MASPPIICFAIYDANTGAPVTGIVPTFAEYKDETGANLTQPSFTEIGAGMYSFTPAFVPNHIITYIVNTGHAPAYYSGWIRPEDFNPVFIGSIGGLSFLTAVSVDATTVDVTFSAPPASLSQALDATQYSISPALAVLSVRQISSTVFRLTTSAQTNGTVYTITWPTH